LFIISQKGDDHNVYTLLTVSNCEQTLKKIWLLFEWSDVAIFFCKVI